jgi:hypothetical protein
MAANGPKRRGSGRPFTGTPGPGRPPGAKNLSTIERELKARHGIAVALEGGPLPLTVLLCRMRDQPLPDGRQVTDEMFEAAQAAAPYIHARLASTTATVTSDNIHRVIADRPLSIEEWNEKYNVHANDAAALEHEDATGTEC